MVLNLFSGVAVLACKRLIIVFTTFRGLLKYRVRTIPLTTVVPSLIWSRLRAVSGEIMRLIPAAEFVTEDREEGAQLITGYPESASHAGGQD